MLEGDLAESVALTLTLPSSSFNCCESFRDAGDINDSEHQYNQVFSEYIAA